MQKIISSAFVALIILTALPAYAATISLTPSTVSAAPGQSFTIAVDVDPQGSKLYTVKTHISYPADLFEVTGFTIDSAWPLTPPGNSIDNTGGSLTQTAGFVGGFTTTKRFGIMTVRAKADGVATLAVTSSSAAYDSKSNNTLSGVQGTSVATIATTPEAPKLTQKQKENVPIITASTEGEGEATTTTETIFAQETDGEEQVAFAQQSLLAAVGSIVTLGTDSTTVGLLVVVAILALAGYALYAVIQRVRRKNAGNPQ